MRPLLLALLLLCTHCTLVGAGIGAAVPKYTRLADVNAERGSDVRFFDKEDVVLAAGKLDGYEDGTFRFHDRYGRHTLAADRVRRIERRDGSYALTGVAIGIALDVVATIAIVSACLAVNESLKGLGGF